MLLKRRLKDYTHQNVDELKQLERIHQFHSVK